MSALNDEEAGFGLLEATISIALVSVAIGGLLAALVLVRAPTASARGLVQSVAANLLVDARAAYAYDSADANAAPPRSQAIATTVTAPGGAVLTVNCLLSGSGSQLTVHCTLPGSEEAVTVSSALGPEAPRPGATLDPYGMLSQAR